MAKGGVFCGLSNGGIFVGNGWRMSLLRMVLLIPVSRRPKNMYLIKKKKTLYRVSFLPLFSFGDENCACELFSSRVLPGGVFFCFLFFFPVFPALLRVWKKKKENKKVEPAH
jgi:hypothetical protein